MAEKRLIAADEAVDGIVAQLEIEWGYEGIREDVQRIFDSVPTVDAVEVVRCKDCKHYEFGVCLKIYSDGAASKYAWQIRKEDDFCSGGERKMVNLEDVVDIEAQTKANNEAMRKVIDFMVGERRTDG